MRRSARRSSRTLRILLPLATGLALAYLLLALTTGRPALALAGETAAVVALWLAYAVRFAFDGPWVIAPEMLWFRLRDRLWPPPHGAIVFLGSSTIAHWSSLADDMAPLPVLNRGINGARLRQLPHYVAVPVFFLSIKPPLRRAPSADAFRAANDLVRDMGRSEPRLRFIDVTSALLDGDGQPNRALFEVDGIHLNEAGYRALASAVKPGVEPG